MSPVDMSICFPVEYSILSVDLVGSSVVCGFQYLLSSLQAHGVGVLFGFELVEVSSPGTIIV